MDSSRKTAFVTGALFIVTFVTAIPAALLLYTPVLDDPNFIVGAGPDTGVALGAFLEVLIIANVGTAVALFPHPQAAERTARARLAEEPRGRPGVRLGAVARHLPHGQGIQGLRDPAAPARSPRGRGTRRGAHALAGWFPT